MRIPVYSLIFNMDGKETSDDGVESPSRASAIASAKDTFQRRIAKERPKEAFCAVFEGLKGEDEPLGCWDFQAGRRPLLIWVPDED